MITIELRKIPKAELFNFPYKFYEAEFKKSFEEDFYNYYLLHQIGFETKDRFKHMLKVYLDSNYVKFKKLYDIELECKDINFMLNKDLKETIVRELNGNSNVENTSTSSTEATTDENGISNSNNKVSSIADGVSSASLENGYLTGVGNDTTNSTSTGTATTTSDSANKGLETMAENETNTLLSQGNIGVTSSAQLLKEYRETIIDLNYMLIEGARSLFMSVY